jgi:hypothetical protein
VFIQRSQGISVTTGIETVVNKKTNHLKFFIFA